MKISGIQSSLDKLLASGGGSGSVNEQTLQLQRKLETLRRRVDSFHDDLFEKRGLNASGYKDSLSHFRHEIKRIGGELRSTDVLFEQFNAAFKQAERLHAQANSSVAQVHTQLRFIGRKNEEQAGKLEAVKQVRRDHEQNVKMQGFAKQAREVAEGQQDKAATVAERATEMIREAHRALKDLQDVLAKYEQLESGRSARTLFDDYEAIRRTAQTLVTESQMQKQLLDSNVNEVSF